MRKNSRLIAQRSVLVVALCALLIAPRVSVEAQQPKKIPRVGFLIASSAAEQHVRLEAFRQGLRELGYVE